MHSTHLICWVQDNTLSAAFYKKIGFSIEHSDDDHTIVALGALRIDLVSMRDEDPFTKDALAGTKGLGLYIAIRVDDVDATHRALAAKNVPSITQPKDWPWGNREFVLKDPDGYKLCFWQPMRKIS